MDTQVEELLAAFSDLRRHANVQACVGRPFEKEKRTVIPIGKVSTAFGLKIGPETDAESIEELIGGGTDTRPLALIELTPGGTRVKSLVNRQLLMLVRSITFGWAIAWLVWAVTRIVSEKR